MVSLHWPSKSLQRCEPARLAVDTRVFPAGAGYPSAAIGNQLFLGDNLALLEALLPEYENRLDLIYADPPFFTNKRFPARVGRGENSRRPGEWQLAEGYTDSWNSLESYLDFLYPRLALMVRLLSPAGTIYLHLDWHADAYARLLLDELLGRENLVNEIIWTYHGPSPIRRAFNRKHDTLLVYARSDQYIFNSDAVREPYHPNTVKTFGSSPRAGFGKVPNLARGKVPEDWWYFPVTARLHNERTGYPTQKPVALLERILLASSNPGSLVADFFCGSGTLPVVAARHQRRFLAADSSWRAIHTTRTRLVSAGSPPFSISHDSLGKFPASGGLLSVARDGRQIRLIDPPALDYWEVDPDWDGRVFKSAAQACRPIRTADIPLEIKLPAEPTRVSVRAISVDGQILTADI